MTSHLLFVTGNDRASIVTRLENLQEDQSFTELYVSMIHLDDTIADALVEAIKLREWDALHVAHCSGYVDRVISAALDFQQVPKISLLPAGHLVQDECLYVLAKGLQKNTSVKSLVLKVDLTVDLAEALAEGLGQNTGLEELSLLLSTSDKEAISALAVGLHTNKTLKSLKLNRCSLEDGHVAELIQALDHHPSLFELSVEGSSCRARGIVSLTGLLQRTSTSTSQPNLMLNLQNQEFEENGQFGVNFLAPFLPRNKSMRFLDLSRNELSHAELACLASALSENSALQELRLVDCNISDRGAKLLAHYLPGMTGLRKLWLYGNPFKAEGAKALLEALRTNVHLEEMLIPRGKNKQMDQIQQEMEYYLILNRGGRCLMYDKDVNLALWPRVLERTSELSWDYSSNKNDTAHLTALYHLLQGPASFAGREASSI